MFYQVPKVSISIISILILSGSKLARKCKNITLQESCTRKKLQEIKGLFEKISPLSHSQFCLYGKINKTMLHICSQFCFPVTKLNPLSCQVRCEIIMSCTAVSKVCSVHSPISPHLRLSPHGLRYCVDSNRFTFMQILPR